MLKTICLTKCYNNGSQLVKALDNVTLTFEKGKVYGVVGHNGAGKTTLIKLLCGLVFPTTGSVMIDKKPLYPDNFKLLSRIGAILEGSRNIFWNLTPIQNVRYFSMLRGLSYKEVAPIVENYFEIFELKSKLDTPVRNLSQGMKQKIAIIVSLLHNPDILLLDEPTLGLDPNSSNSMQKLIRDIAVNKKKLVIITSHQLSLIEKLSDEIVFLSKGTVCYYGSIKGFVSGKSKQMYILTLNSDLRSISGDFLKNREFVEINDKQNLATLSIPEDELNTVLRYLVSKNISILSVEKRMPTLEEVFLNEATE